MSFIIICLYRPPSSDNTFYDEFKALLSKFENTGKELMIVISILTGLANQTGKKLKISLANTISLKWFMAQLELHVVQIHRLI